MKKVAMLLLCSAMFFCFSTSSYAFFIDFESGLGRNLQQIDDITGVSFALSGQYDWIYGDSSTLTWNTRSIDLGYSNGTGAYQHYGNVFAFLGTDGPAGWGKVDFDNNDGTWFRTGYTSLSNFFLEGYNSAGVMIASTSGTGNTYGADMGWLTINAPTGQYFDYIIMHDTGNYFLVDNMSGDASGVGSPVPEPATMSLLGFGLLGLLGFRKKSI
jgi:hypothetical protein